MPHPPLLLVLFAVLLASEPLRSQEAPRTIDALPMDSLATVLQNQLANVSSPELDRHRTNKRLYLGQAYARITRDVSRHDGLGAVFAYIKTRLQGWLSLPPRVMIARQRLPGFTLQAPMGVALAGGRVLILESGWGTLYQTESWNIPSDPWEREQ